MFYDVSNFQEEVLKRSYEIPVLVDFWAEWCGPCRVLGPLLERFAEQNGDRWVLAKVNTVIHAEVARNYGIRSIPNVKLFVDGVVVDEFVGALPEHQIQRWLDAALPSKHLKLLAQAEQLIREGKPSEAEGLLRPIVQAEPDNMWSRVLLARSVLLSDPIEAGRLLENVDEPRFSELIESIRSVARLHGFIEAPRSPPDAMVRDLYQQAIRALFARDFDLALSRFIEAIRTDRFYDNDGPRKACIAIFKLLGDDHEITRKHRRDFSSALY